MSVEATNCYDAISHLHEAMQDALMPGQRYFVLGGIASGAIKHPDTVFDHETKTVIAAEDSAEPVLRDNGSRRDVDILVDDVLSERSAERLKRTVGEAVEDNLVVSVFGFDQRDPRMNRARRFKSAAADWISRRTIDEDGVIRYELFPLEQAVPHESFSPWMLKMPNESEVSVLSPAGHVLAYTMRSISGIRHKDLAKVQAMKDRVYAETEFAADISTGVFSTWRQFADAIEQLKLGVGPGHPIVRDGAGKMDTEAFRLKGNALAFIEGNERIVNIAQQELPQKILNVFVRAK